MEDGIKKVRERFQTEDEFQSELRKEGLTTAQFEQRIQDPPSLDPQALVEVVQRDPEGIELLPGDRHPRGAGSPGPPLPLRLRIASSRFIPLGPLGFLQDWLTLVARITGTTN